MLYSKFHTCFPIIGSMYAIAGQFEYFNNILPDVVIVLNDQYFFTHVIGNEIVNNVPWFTLLLKSILPFISPAYLATILSPRPVPGIFPVLCALKNASNKCFWSVS